MSRKCLKRIVVVLFSAIILLIMGIELVSNNVIQIMEVIEESKDIQDISAEAPEIAGTLSTPTRNGYGPDQIITGGSLSGADANHQYLYAPRNILCRS